MLFEELDEWPKFPALPGVGTWRCDGVLTYPGYTANGGQRHMELGVACKKWCSLSEDLYCQ